MKNCWSILILAALLQSFAVVVLAGGHHGHGSSLAHILAAGLIVQLLSARGHHGHHHGGHHHHEGRHSGMDVHSDHSPYSQEGWGLEHNPMTPEATFASSAWAQRSPMDIAYSHAQYKEPVMETYNVPYFYRPPGMW